MHELSKAELTGEFTWMCENETARTLSMRYQCPVWTSGQGYLEPVALMSVRRLATLLAYLKRRLAKLPARDLLDRANSDWYLGDAALFDDLDRDDDPERARLEYWISVCEVWLAREEPAAVA